MTDFKGEQFKPVPSKDLDSKGLVAWAESGFQLGYHSRRPYQDMVELAMHFWAGDQWFDLASDAIAYYSRRELSPDACEKIKRVNNQIPVFIRSIVAAVMDNTPDLEAVPATSQEEDKIAAQLGTYILKWRDRADKEELLREQEALWLMSAGEVLRKTYWDADANDGQGDIVSEVVDFFRYVKDPYSTGTWPPRWIIEFDARDVDWVREKYGNKKLEPEAVTDITAVEDSLAYNGQLLSRDRRDAQGSSVILKRLTLPPSKRFPKGHTYVWAGDVLLHEHDLQAGMFPYSSVVWFPVPRRLYPISLIELILSDQRHLNVLLSKMDEIMSKQLRGDIITRGAGENPVTQEIVDAKTGRKHIRLPSTIEQFELMKYDTNLQLAQVSLERIFDDLHNKSGQSIPTLGQTLRKQVTVGELQIAREGDFASLHWHLSQINRHLADVASQKLQLAKEYYKKLTLINMFDGPGRPKNMSDYFVGADLRGTKDVIYIPQPHLTPAMKRQVIMEAYKGGMAGPYQSDEQQLAARIMLKYMGVPELEEEVERVYGPIEQLEGYVQAMQEIRRRAQIGGAMQALQAAEAAPEAPGAVPGAEAMPAGGEQAQMALPAGAQEVVA
jgi:hypothetical protein